jgi:hypothetical protein
MYMTTTESHAHWPYTPTIITMASGLPPPNNPAHVEYLHIAFRMKIKFCLADALRTLASWAQSMRL